MDDVRQRFNKDYEEGKRQLAQRQLERASRK